MLLSLQSHQLVDVKVLNQSGPLWSLELNAAPNYFQQQLALALHDVQYVCCELIIDDLIIFGKMKMSF